MKTLLILTSLFVLFGCIQTLTLHDVSFLRKEISIAEAKKLSKINPKYEFKIKNPDNPDDEISVLVYELSSGSMKSNYFYFFLNKKLEFWGYPHEYARSSDKLINYVGKKSVEFVTKNE